MQPASTLDRYLFKFCLFSLDERRLISRTAHETAVKRGLEMKGILYSDWSIIVFRGLIFPDIWHCPWYNLTETSATLLSGVTQWTRSLFFLHANTTGSFCLTLTVCNQITSEYFRINNRLVFLLG